MASPGTFFHMLSLFDKTRTFTGSNWATFKTEFMMTFQADTDFLGVIDGSIVSSSAAVSAAIASVSITSTTTPSQVPGPGSPPVHSLADKVWLQHNANARTALWRCITSDLVRQRHIKPQSTAAEIWASLRSEYERDARAPRISLKRRMMHAVHDASKPVDVFIGEIVEAGEQLTAMGAPPGKHDVVDCIIVNLHSDWHVIQTQLIARPGDLDLQEVRSTLVDWEAQHGVIHGKGSDAHIDAQAESDDAHAARAKPPRKSRGHSRDRRRHSRRARESDSDGSVSDPEDFNWGNPGGPDDACSRCGRHGHRARHCIVDMPSDVKTRVMNEVRGKNRRRRKEAMHAEHYHRRRSRSPSSSDSDSGQSYYSGRAHAAWGNDVSAAVRARVLQ